MYIVVNFALCNSGSMAPIYGAVHGFRCRYHSFCAIASQFPKFKSAPSRGAQSKGKIFRVCVTTSQNLPQSDAEQGHQPVSKFEQLMQHARLTHIAHEVWASVLRPGDIAIDATAGNGHDTTFLARAVGPMGLVYAFDIQESAIQATRQTVQSKLSESERGRIHYVQKCHSQMQEEVGSHKARVICFNLGYLPHGDKTVITTVQTTVHAVEAALEVLMPGGLLSILSYTSHPGGLEEYDAVNSILTQLPPAYWVTSQIKLLNRQTAPILLLAWKRHFQRSR